MKIKQLISYPNPNELGLGNTNETYIRIENSIDVSDIFPDNKEVSICDSKTGKTYVVKAKIERTEFRINKLGQLYRDYNFNPGDEIKFTYIEKKNEKAIFFSVTHYKRIFLSVGLKGTEIVNIENLSPFTVDAGQKNYNIPISEGEIQLRYEKSERKRADSPSETDFYSTLVNNIAIAKGNYYVTLSDEKNLLEDVKKNNVEEFTVPEDLTSTTVCSLNLPLQQIYYGAPGTGKSFEIKSQTKGQSVIRTTFHPDSDYSTFVGAYKPTMEESEVQVVPVVTTNGISLEQNKGTYKENRISYTFVKQAFLKAYLSAWKKYAEATETASPQFLIIEEINRGNCAQIFGDLFQLLDRADNKFSSYPIEADTDLQVAIENAFKDEDEFKLNADLSIEDAVDDYTSNYGATLSEDVQHGRILLLPPNLFIWATMNTSDQSLFPIDSAFKRRWDWKYVKIANGYKKNANGEFVLDDKNERIPLGWTIKVDTEERDWWKFITEINKHIANATSSDDKKLGYFFCKPAKGETQISEETFVGKVIFYLWNDVFKDNDTSLFKINNEEPSFDNFYTENEAGQTIPNKEAIKKFLVNVMKDEGIKNQESTEPASADEEKDNE